MTEEIYNKATNLRSLIEIDKKALKYWKEAVDATDETITLSNGLGYNGYKKASIFRFISFKELKDMANCPKIGKHSSTILSMRA